MESEKPSKMVFQFSFQKWFFNGFSLKTILESEISMDTGVRKQKTILKSKNEYKCSMKNAIYRAPEPSSELFLSYFWVVASFIAP